MPIFSQRRFNSSNVRKKVVWNDKDTFLETVRVDTEIQADILSKTKSLFCNVLLPELVGKYFTNSTNSDKSQDKWCICKILQTVIVAPFFFLSFANLFNKIRLKLSFPFGEGF